MSETAVIAMKRNIVLAAHQAGEGHVASAFSILDILWVLYDQVLRADNPADQISGDRFVLSKGHASLALYAVLAAKGKLPADAMENFCAYYALLGGHPDSVKVPHIEASTGSLGHGLPIATGMALGAKIRGHANQIFCLVGDGECNEGSVWESALLASHHQLSQLTCIVDYNHSTDRALHMGDLVAKFKAFGWDAESIDGHNHDQIKVF